MITIMAIILVIANILQKTRKLLVKLVNLKVSLLNQLNLSTKNCTRSTRPPGQNATEVIVNNIRDVVTNQTLQCVLNTSVDPASIDCTLPPNSTITTTLSVSLTIKCTPDDTIPRSAQACNRITTEILPNMYNIEIIGNNPNPNHFNGSTVHVIVILGPDSFLVDVTVSTQVIETIINNIQSDLNVNIFGPTEHFIGQCPSGEIFAGESLSCNIEERLTVASN